MTNMTKEVELLREERITPQRYNYSAGTVGSRFLVQLRDNKKITGAKCPTCNRVYVPPKSNCQFCFDKLESFIDVSDMGTLQTYTVISSPQSYYPLQPPFVLGVIKLDGVDTGLVHVLGEVDFEEVGIGMRVKAVFRDERVGSIRDIKYFRPIVR